MYYIRKSNEEIVKIHIQIKVDKFVEVPSNDLKVDNLIYMIGDYQKKLIYIYIYI